MNLKRTPNWNKWRHIPHVKLWQAVALSLDIDPDKVVINKDSWMGDGLAFQESQEFKDRIAIVKANFGKHQGLQPTALNIADGLSSEIRLNQFPSFANHVNWTLPNEFPDLVRPNELKADFEKWKSYELWRIVEAAYLLAGLEPLKVSVIADGAPASDFYRKLKDAVSRGSLNQYPSPSNAIGDARIDPSECIRWARDRSLPIPDELQSLGAADFKSGASVKPTDETLGTKERTTLLVIIGALAAELAVDFSKPSKAATTIEAMTQKLGAPLTSRAIENHLRLIPDALDRRSK